MSEHNNKRTTTYLTLAYSVVIEFQYENIVALEQTNNKQTNIHFWIVVIRDTIQRHGWKNYSDNTPLNITRAERCNETTLKSFG